MLRITFLGTGTSQGVPMIGCECEVCRSIDRHDKRLRSSVMIERFPYSTCGTKNSTTPSSRIVIDAGPDFRYQMLRADVRSLDAILLTHEHKDHIAGIDDVRAFNYFDNKAIPIYATERTAKIVKKDYDYAFGENKYPGVPEIDLQIIDPAQPFIAAGLRVMPINGRHLRMPVTGYRIGDITYLTDFNSIDNKELEKITGSEILVINALRHEKHLSHFTVDEAVEVFHRSGAKRAFLTHMSHQIGVYEQIKDSLPANVQFAYDGLTIELCE